MSGFKAGFEKTAITKEAGLFRRTLNKLKRLVTGNEYLYHGTSSKRARKISKEGILPDRSGGVWGVQKGMAELGDKVGLGIPGLSGNKESHQGISFATKEPSVAKSYAQRQELMERLGRASAFLRKTEAKHGKTLPKWIRGPIREGLKGELSRKFRPVFRKMLADTLANTPVLSSMLPKGHTFELAVPKEQLKKMQVADPYKKVIADRYKAAIKESDELAKENKPLALMKRLGDWAANRAETGYMKHDVAIKGGFSPGYLKNKKK